MELEHLIENSVLLATGDTIKEIHLPHQKKNLTADPGKGDIVIKTIDENEKEYILKILKHVQGRIGGYRKPHIYCPAVEQMQPVKHTMHT